MLPNLSLLALKDNAHSVPPVGPIPERHATITVEPTVDCAICMEPIHLFTPDTYVLACASRHAFHTTCLKNHVIFNDDASCPECREAILPQTLDRLSHVLTPPPPMPPPPPGSASRRGPLRALRSPNPRARACVSHRMPQKARRSQQQRGVPRMPRTHSCINQSAPGAITRHHCTNRPID